MQALAHRPNRSQTAILADYKQQIHDEVDRMAMRVGGLLREAREAAPTKFDRWVTDELPFGLDTARRLMAIHEAYSTRPPEVVALLPKPWQALFALRVLPAADLAAALEAGEIGTHTTELEAKAYARRWRTGSSTPPANPRNQRADLAAGALMEFTTADLTDPVLRALRKWLMR